MGISSRLNDEDAQTIKNYLELGAVTTKTTTSATPTITTGQEPAEDRPVVHAETPKQPLKSALINNNNNNNNHQLPYGQNNGQGEAEKQDVVMMKQQEQKNLGTTTAHHNNTFSGLNLNMTASEMKALISKRKKFDPKKAGIDLRRKYEIIQQM